MTKRDVTTSKLTRKKETASKSAGISVQQLATQIGVSVERLLMQFKDAKISVSGPEDIVAEE